MDKLKTFTIQQIEASLKKLKIPYSLSYTDYKTHYSFKSLRNIEPNGIYYLVNEISNPPPISESIIICNNSGNNSSNNIYISVEDPQLTFYLLMDYYFSENENVIGIHPTAIISNDSVIDPSAYIGPYCVLDSCVVKAGARLHSHVTVMQGSTIEENVIIESHSTVGATGVAWIWDPSTRKRVIQPQIGYTTIHRDSFLGSDVTIVRGSVNETTSIGQGCVIAHGSKIGHGSRIGDQCHFANNISIAGNVTLGKKCFIGSGAVIRPQTRLADDTVVGAGAVVVKNIDEPGLVLVGAPAKPKKSIHDKLSGVPKALVK